MPEPHAYVSPKAAADQVALQVAIDEIRRTGRSLSFDELHEGVPSQGIAFRDPDTSEVVGVAVSYPTTLRTAQVQSDIHNLLSEMLRSLQHETG